MTARRIGFVTNRFPSPSETFLRSLLGHLEAGGHETQVVAHGYPCGEAPLREPGARGAAECALLGSPLSCLRVRTARTGVLRREHVISQRGLLSACLRSRSLRAALVAWQFGGGRFDLVYFSFSGIALAYEPYWSVFDGLVTVISCRGSVEQRAIADLEHRARLVRVLCRANVVHCVSEQMRDQLATWGVPAQRLVVIRPAVDTSIFRPRGSVEPQGELRLLSVGRLTTAKAHDVALRAVALLRDRGYSVRFTIVGDGEMRESLTSQIGQLNLTDIAVLEGVLSPDQIQVRLEECDIFVLASRWEGISNAMLEALAVGCPVVATSIPGTREALGESSAARLVPVDDHVALADALAALHRAPSQAMRMGEAGRALAITKFGLERQRTEWLQLIKQAHDTTLR
jgi:glycosyltransferase involved in cell wall biosynthesis